jgi:hypothetical protein
MRPRPLAWSPEALSLPQREAPPVGYFGETFRDAKARSALPGLL